MFEFDGLIFVFSYICILRWGENFSKSFWFSLIKYNIIVYIYIFYMEIIDFSGVC